MLQKKSSGYITSLNEFKTDPVAAISEAKGDAIAVSLNNEIQFYAVPTALFEEMVAFCEYAQRGITEQKNIPAKFKGEGINMDKIAEYMAKKIKGDLIIDHKEWP